MHGVVPGLGLLCLFMKHQITSFGHVLTAIDRLAQDARQLDRLEVTEQKAYAATICRGPVDDLASEERLQNAGQAIEKMRREKGVESSNLICKFLLFTPWSRLLKLRKQTRLSTLWY